MSVFAGRELDLPGVKRALGPDRGENIRRIPQVRKSMSARRHSTGVRTREGCCRAIPTRPGKALRNWIMRRLHGIAKYMDSSERVSGYGTKGDYWQGPPMVRITRSWPPACGPGTRHAAVSSMQWPGRSRALTGKSRHEAQRVLTS
jgi:hypothetical protein